MPTYVYRCKDCGADLEVVQKFTDDPLTVCPECEGNLRKVFNAVGVVFKGSGFYRTDSRQTKSSSDAPATKTETKPDGAAGSTSAATKPAGSGGDSSGGASKPKTGASSGAGTAS